MSFWRRVHAVATGTAKTDHSRPQGPQRHRPGESDSNQDAMKRHSHETVGAADGVLRGGGTGAVGGR